MDHVRSRFAASPIEKPGHLICCPSCPPLSPLSAYQFLDVYHSSCKFTGDHSKQQHAVAQSSIEVPTYQCNQNNRSESPSLSYYLAPVPRYSSLSYRWGVQRPDKHAREDAMGRSVEKTERGWWQPDEAIKHASDTIKSRPQAKEDV